MPNFKPGDKVIAVRNKTENDREWDFSGKYPPLGITGVLVRLCDDSAGYPPNNEWEIAWDKRLPSGGDLVREWMIKRHEPEWDT